MVVIWAVPISPLTTAQRNTEMFCLPFLLGIMEVHLSPLPVCQFSTFYIYSVSNFHVWLQSYSVDQKICINLELPEKEMGSQCFSVTGFS